MTAYTMNMNQAATYWPAEANDGFGGVGHGAPVPIMCRWQDKADLVRDAQGKEFVSSSVVYVDRELAAQGKLALGAYEGAPVEGAKEIRALGKSPSLEASQTLHKVWL
jgi:hypothetical protein